MSIAEATYTFVADYLDADAARDLHCWLLENAHWRTERFQLYGRSMVVPRLVAWYGEPGVRYRYSGIDHCADGWPEPLTSVLECVRAEFAPGTNFALLNRYRNGADSIGWHTDNEPGVADPVVSISLGATRRFHLRRNFRAPSVGLNLAHGSLLIHSRDYPHAVPKTRKLVGERISISFRTIVSP